MTWQTLVKILSAISLGIATVAAFVPTFTASILGFALLGATLWVTAQLP